ncbi:MAG TPA: sigma-70 family RNA polymerase sigma factor [Actinomycetota bacterium]|nr:sigma-70 family RNA polymerase sigma factor [Actinomycetota bacterium]
MAVAERILHLRPIIDLRSDASLVKAAQSGAEDAAEALARRYYGKVHSFVSYMTYSSASHPDDLTQEVFARAWGALPRFNGRYQFSAWLLRIARNLMIDEARRRLRAPTLTDPVDLEKLEPIDPTDHVWEAVRSDATARSVREVLADMPMRQRTVLVLREIEGLSYSEIAAVMGTNDRAIEGILRRARERFRTEGRGALALAPPGFMRRGLNEILRLARIPDTSSLSYGFQMVATAAVAGIIAVSSVAPPPVGPPTARIASAAAMTADPIIAETPPVVAGRSQVATPIKKHLPDVLQTTENQIQPIDETAPPLLGIETSVIKVRIFGGETIRVFGDIAAALPASIDLAVGPIGPVSNEPTGSSVPLTGLPEIIQSYLPLPRALMRIRTK